MLEIVDQNNQPTGKYADISEATDNGYWHRGVHAIIFDKDGNILVQKRSKTIYFYPNMIDISVGGAVDAGEGPLEAIKREIKEELGLLVLDEDVKFLKIFVSDRCDRKLHKISRTFVYSYLVKINRHEPKLKIQKSELESAEFISVKTVKKLIRLRALKSIGKIIPKYRYYAWLVKNVETELSNVAQL